MTEKQLQGAVEELAALLKWRSYHTYDSRRSALGFPDLVLVRDDRLLFVELKTLKGSVSSSQADWMRALWDVPHVETYLWTPTHWLSGLVEKVLRAGSSECFRRLEAAPPREGRVS